jgi:hypothetical protein
MKLVHTEAVQQGDPANRPAEVTWTDTRIPALTTFFYRLAAVDDSGNVSMPSSYFAGQAYDYSPPIEPTWERSEWVKLDSAGNIHPWNDMMGELVEAVALVFTTSQANVSALIERQNGIWRSATPWVRKPDFDKASKVWRFTFYDRNARPTEPQHYRARLMSSAGVILESVTERLVEVPTV